MTTTNGSAQRLLNMRTNIPGQCLRFVTRAILGWQGLPPRTPAGYAYLGWLYSKDRHPGDANPPRDYPVYFGPSPTRHDVNAPYGDVAISLGGGLLACTDVQTGKIGIMTIASRAAQTRRPYLGWTGDFLGYQLTTATPTGGGSTPITPQEDELSAAEVATILETTNVMMQRATRARLFTKTSTGLTVAVNYNNGVVLPITDGAGQIVALQDKYEYIGHKEVAIQLTDEFWVSLTNVVNIVRTQLGLDKWDGSADV